MHGCRDLGIGGEAHKKIDAAVRKGGFEIVSGPFELGTLTPTAAQSPAVACLACTLACSNSRLALKTAFWQGEVCLVLVRTVSATTVGCLSAQRLFDVQHANLVCLLHGHRFLPVC